MSFCSESPNQIKLYRLERGVFADPSHSFFQECESEGANKMMEYLRDLVSKSKPGEKYGKYVPKKFSFRHPTQYLDAENHVYRKLCPPSCG